MIIRLGNLSFFGWKLKSTRPEAFLYTRECLIKVTASGDFFGWVVVVEYIQYFSPEVTQRWPINGSCLQPGSVGYLR